MSHELIPADNSEYDRIAKEISLVLAYAELNKTDASKAVAEWVHTNEKERVANWPNLDTAHQVAGCDITIVEVKGSKFMDYFMSKARPNYGHYSLELVEFLETFDNEQEIVAFTMQLLNLIRIKKEQTTKSQVRWNDHLSGF